jgi:hypothetical protein
MEKSIYREHSRSCADDLPRAIEGFGPGPRLLDLDCCGGKLLSKLVERTGVEGHRCSKGSPVSPQCTKTNDQ